MWLWFDKPCTSERNDEAAIMAAERMVRTCSLRPVKSQAEELGTISYVNLNGDHGDMNTSLQAAKVTGKPIFANFVEWPG